MGGGGGVQELKPTRSVVLPRTVVMCAWGGAKRVFFVDIYIFLSATWGINSTVVIAIARVKSWVMTPCTETYNATHE